jgi:hypothetical protein
LEIVDVCRLNNVSLLPYSPLKGGYLTDKIKPGMRSVPENSRIGSTLNDANNVAALAVPFEMMYNNELYDCVYGTCQTIAKKYGKTCAQVALRYLLHKNFVCSVIIGCTSIRQLEESMDCLSFDLSQEDMNELDCVSFPKQFLPAPYNVNAFLELTRSRCHLRRQNNFVAANEEEDEEEEQANVPTLISIPSCFQQENEVNSRQQRRLVSPDRQQQKQLNQEIRNRMGGHGQRGRQQQSQSPSPTRSDRSQSPSSSTPTNSREPANQRRQQQQKQPSSKTQRRTKSRSPSPTANNSRSPPTRRRPSPSTRSSGGERSQSPLTQPRRYQPTANNNNNGQGSRNQSPADKQRPYKSNNGRNKQQPRESNNSSNSNNGIGNTLGNIAHTIGNKLSDVMNGGLGSSNSEMDSRSNRQQQRQTRK